MLSEHLSVTRHLCLPLLLGGALACNPASALEIPKSSRADHRVRYATYDPANVIQLDAVIGVATSIELEKNESYVYHVFGDSAAYAFTYKDNHLFFKPIAEQANTNLIVVTDKRSYAFRLSFSDRENARALYKLVIRYPQSQADAALQAREQTAIRQAFSQSSEPVNWQGYMKSGDLGIAPVHAWDNGQQTWLQFAPESDTPTAYRVTPDGQEVITNFHMAGDGMMVLHRTAPLWHLRLGDQVVAIHNEDYGESVDTVQTGTISPNVVRVVTGTDAPQDQLVLPSRGSQ